MKGGEVIEAAFITQLFDADLVLYQQFAGVAHPDFVNKLEVGFTGFGLKISAKRVGGQISYLRYFFKRYFFSEMGK